MEENIKNIKELIESAKKENQFEGNRYYYAIDRIVKRYEKL